ncbi:MAG: cupin domain-containing protein [Bacteroidales bacterium]
MNRISWLMYVGFLGFILVSFKADLNLKSGVYSPDGVSNIKTKVGMKTKVLSSGTSTLENLEVWLEEINPGKSLSSLAVGSGTDEMLILREGNCELMYSSGKSQLHTGSVVVLGEGEKYDIKATGKSRLVFFRFIFKPGKAAEAVKSGDEVKPFICDWDTLSFKPSANGGRRNIINQRCTVLKNLEIHTTLLKEGLPSHAAHVHPDDEIILVRKGIAEESIGDEHFLAPGGSVIFLSANDPHGIRNAGTGECEYYAIRWITNLTRSAK